MADVNYCYVIDSKKCTSRYAHKMGIKKNALILKDLENLLNVKVAKIAPIMSQHLNFLETIGGLSHITLDVCVTQY